MLDLVPWFLFLHVLGAIIAFGPGFSFPIIGRMSGAEPMHGNFATRVSFAISTQRVIPVALTMPVTGIGLIWSVGIDPFERGARWLLLGIILYTVALVYSMAIQLPTVRQILALTAGPPPGAPPGPPPGGPPPGLMALIARARRGGLLVSGLAAAIVFLMVVKPDLGF
ncbi:MAG: DUF2269 family protein [Chloroflexota bacterium]|nr:DUF2269 family protein [Chloroflexota bacterium]